MQEEDNGKRNEEWEKQLEGKKSSFICHRTIAVQYQAVKGPLDRFRITLGELIQACSAVIGSFFHSELREDRVKCTLMLQHVCG